jgi:branched-chain amino acid transport system permease protein
MLLFLLASGLTLVFGMMRILNVAHAGFYMLGAYLAFTVTTISGSFWVALLVVPVVVGIVGCLVERFLIRPIARAGHAYELILTFGLFYVIGEAVLWVWGSYPLRVPTPDLLAGSVPLFGARYPLYRLFILGISAVVCIAMAAVLLRTRAGMVIRAAVSDGEMLGALGINTEIVRILVFGIGSGLAAMSGVIAAPFLQANPGMGALILLDGFAVVVLGGFGSLLGALIAALVIGLVQSFGIFLFPSLAGFLPVILMWVLLTLRPQGFRGAAT